MEKYTVIAAWILNTLGVIAFFLIAVVITARIFKRICINPLLNEMMDLREELAELKKGKAE